MRVQVGHGFIESSNSGNLFLQSTEIKLGLLSGVFLPLGRRREIKWIDVNRKIRNSINKFNAANGMTFIPVGSIGFPQTLQSRFITSAQNLNKLFSMMITRQ